MLFILTLTVVSFTLFGLTNTLSLYNKEATTFHSIKDSQIDYISIGKTMTINENDFSYEEDSHLSKIDYQNIKDRYPQLNFMNTFSSSNYGTNLDYYQYVQNITQLSEAEDYLFYSTSLSSLGTIDQQTIKENNFTLTGSLPKNNQEIVITEFSANVFKNFGYQITDDNGKVTSYPIKSTHDLIGKSLELTLNSQKYQLTICGTLDTHIDLTRYQPLTDENNTGLSQYYLSSEFSILFLNSYHNIGYISNELLETIIDNYHVYPTHANGKFLNLFLGDEYYPIDFFYHEKDIDPSLLISFENNGQFYMNYHLIKYIRINDTMTLQDYIYQQITDPTDEQEMQQVIMEAIKTYKDKITSANINLSLYGQEYIENIIDQIAGVYIGDLNTESYEVVMKDAAINQYQFQAEGYAHCIVAPMTDDETLKDIVRNRTYGTPSYNGCETNVFLHENLAISYNQTKASFASHKRIYDILHAKHALVSHPLYHIPMMMV